ncbi:MAG: YdcF family protein, partial [Acetobacteraceae bacterium]|nr:YdcF family protein [Acetobacteraceae bacterium]
MSFILSKLLWLLLSPGVFLLLVALAGLLLLFRAPDRAGRVLLVAGLGTLALVALLPAGNFASLPLEDRFPPPSPMPSHVDGIIVLGGAVETALTESRGLPALNGAAERMTALVELARRYPDARLAFTGGSGSLASGEVSEADVARALWSAMGVPSSRIVFEGLSRNTWENALFLKDLVRPQAGEVWLLVTSALHMPRAVGIFRRAGWPVVPYPVGYKTARDWRVWSHAGFGEHLDLLDGAAHEYL